MYGINSQYDFSKFDGGTESCSVEMFDLNNKTTCNDGYIYDDTFFDETLATNLDLVCDKRSLQKLLGVIQILATIFGSILGGKLGDKFGRKNTCFLAILILGPVVTSAGFVHSYHGLYTFFGSLKSESIQIFFNENVHIFLFFRICHSPFHYCYNNSTHLSKSTSVFYRNLYCKIQTVLHDPQQ